MGIDLHDRIVSDSQKILNNEMIGGPAVDIKFTDLAATPNEQTINGWYNDVSLSIDMETGLMAVGTKISIIFHQSDLTIWDGIENMQRWKVAFTNGAGQSITAEIKYLMPDRSFGDVVAMCVIDKGIR